MRLNNDDIINLYLDKKLDDAIYKITGGVNKDIVKSELFFILLNGDISNIKKNERIFYCIRILMNMVQSNTSPYYKEYINNGQPNSIINEEINNYDNYIDEDETTTNFIHSNLLDRIEEILNRDIPWYDASLFRLHYLPYKDPHCNKETYSLRQIEKMHTCGEYSIDHMRVYHRVLKTLKHILLILKNEGLLKEDDIKNERMKKIFNNL